MDGAIKDVLNGPHEYVNGKYVVKEAAKPEQVEPAEEEEEEEPAEEEEEEEQE